jgi:hypothetical protein
MTIWAGQRFGWRIWPRNSRQRGAAYLRKNGSPTLDTKPAYILGTGGAKWFGQELLRDFC